MRKCWFLGLWLALAVEVSAQNVAASGKPPDRSLPGLKAVAEPLSTAISELDRLAAELKIATSEERKQELNARIESERERIDSSAVISAILSAVRRPPRSRSST